MRRVRGAFWPRSYQMHERCIIGCTWSLTADVATAVRSSSLYIILLLRSESSRGAIKRCIVKSSEPSGAFEIVSRVLSSAMKSFHEHAALVISPFVIQFLNFPRGKRKIDFGFDRRTHRWEITRRFSGRFRADLFSSSTCTSVSASATL